MHHKEKPHTYSLPLTAISLLPKVVPFSERTEQMDLSFAFTMSSGSSFCGGDDEDRNGQRRKQ